MQRQLKKRMKTLALLYLAAPSKKEQIDEMYDLNLMAQEYANKKGCSATFARAGHAFELEKYPKGKLKLVMIDPALSKDDQEYIEAEWNAFDKSVTVEVLKPKPKRVERKG